jgi:hypothetical protein
MMTSFVADRKSKLGHWCYAFEAPVSMISECEAL